MQGRLGRWLIVGTLVLATGGHWAVLQSIAWFGMFVSFSQTAPIVTALEKTFDGRHPCKLCKVVQEGKRSEKKQEMQKLESKLDLLLVRNVLTVFSLPSFISFPNYSDHVQTRSDSPPTPPPRRA